MSKALFKSTGVVASMTLLSRILGFVRDMVVAQLFGVNASVDAFNVAFKIPNFMRALFAEGCFSQAFVPVLSEYRQQRELTEIRLFISRVAGSLISFLTLLTVIAIIAAPLIVLIFAPGFMPGMPRFDMATHMLRITFPYLMLISLTAFAGAILNSYSFFAIPAFTPVLLNICMIVAAFFIAPHFATPVVGLAWGVLLAGLVQLLFQLPFLYQRQLLPMPRWGWFDPGVKRILKLMLPALFGASIGQISLLLNTVFASFLPVGSVSWLYYSERLAYFPLGVFGVALATVITPHLSREHTAQSKESFAQALDWGVRCNLLIGIPCAIALWILAGPMITTLFKYGRFQEFDVAMTQRSVIAYAIGLPAFMLVKVLSSGFYARQDIKTSVRIGIKAMLANMALNAALIFPLKHAGLALAASLAACFNVALLWRTLIKHQVYRFYIYWKSFYARLIVANLLMGLYLWLAAGSLQQWLNWSGKERLLHLLLTILIAMAIYFTSLFASGLRLHHLRAKY